MSETESKKIYSAIAGMMADMEAIGKEKKNAAQGFMYRGIDQVFNAVHPLFAKHKVFPTCEIVSRDVTERQSTKGGVLFYVNLKARYTFHAEDGSSVSTEAWGEAMDSGDKASNKAMSGAYKYAMFQLLCIPTEAVDPDSQVHEVEPVKQQKTAARKPAAAKPATNGEAHTFDQRFEAAKQAVLTAESEEQLAKVEKRIELSGFTEDQTMILNNFITRRRESLAAEPVNA
jgi:hypothetical protein